MSRTQESPSRRVHAKRKPREFEEFSRRYAAGEPIVALARTLKINKNTAVTWAGTVRLNLGDHFRRICTDAELAERWEKQYQATRGNSRTRVLELITRILDGFPAPKEPPPAQPPITVIVEMDCPPDTPEAEEARVIDQPAILDGDQSGLPDSSAFTRRGGQWATFR